MEAENISRNIDEKSNSLEKVRFKNKNKSQENVVPLSNNDQKGGSQEQTVSDQIVKDSEDSQTNTNSEDINGSYLINGGRKGYRKNTVKRMIKKQNSRKKRTKAARQKRNY